MPRHCVPARNVPSPHTPELRRVLGSCDSVCPRASYLDLGKHLRFTLLIPGFSLQPTFQG